VSYCLGVNSGIAKHDAAAALLRDGSLVAMVEQERLSRRKQAWGESATEAIQCCLSLAKISLADLESISFGWDEKGYARSNGSGWDEAEFLNKVLPPSLFGSAPRPPVHYVRHHLAHAASVYWTSGFADAAILVLDARGEDGATAFGAASGNRIELSASLGLHESLGNFYALAAEWAGLSYLDAGKFMGLAAYGRPTEPMPLRITEGGYSFYDQQKNHGNTDYYFGQRDLLFGHFERETYPFARGDGLEIMAYANFAASVQMALENAVEHAARVLREKTASRNLCLAGGVALNCAMNGRLLRSGDWENIFVPPFAHDAGVSAGAALHTWNTTQRAERRVPRLEHAFWGPSYDEERLLSALRSSGRQYRGVKETEMIEEAAGRILAGELVGWFQGRAEVGPRALGARSLLADPRRRSTVVQVNQAKGREIWRPLALSIADEEAGTFLEAPYNCEFMNFATNVRPGMRNLIPAAVHIDGTTRAHTVCKEHNPRFHRLLRRLGSMSGVPGVVNTSLNGPGEPIVHLPEQAISLLDRGIIQSLFLENFVVTL
jgi:carbamoyltransferase